MPHAGCGLEMSVSQRLHVSSTHNTVCQHHQHGAFLFEGAEPLRRGDAETPRGEERRCRDPEERRGVAWHKMEEDEEDTRQGHSMGAS